jgi:hypothetical protein
MLRENSTRKYILAALLSLHSTPCFAEPPGFEYIMFGILIVIILVFTVPLGFYLKHLSFKLNLNLPNWAVFVIAFVLSACLAIIIF